MATLFIPLNYYGKFLPDLATLIRPAPVGQNMELGELPGTGLPQSQGATLVCTLLTHYNPEKLLVLPCAIGAVLSHQMGDQSEQPIAYAPRTLLPAEIKYAQLNEEALSIVFGQTFSSIPLWPQVYHPV